MRNTWKILLFTVPFCFLFGGWWGLRGYQLNSDQSQYKSDNILRVLTLKNTFPQSVIDSFESLHYVTLKVTESHTPTKLLQELQINPHAYDVVQIFSYQLETLAKANVLQKLNTKQLDHFKWVANDFAKIPGLDQEVNSERLAIPLQWGVNGYLTKSNKPLLLSDLFADTSSTTVFLPEAVELYLIAKRLGHSVDEWLVQENEVALKQTASSLQKVATFTPVNPKNWQPISEDSNFVQAANGPAAHFLAQSKDWKFILPQEQATLWLSMLAVPATSTNKNLSTTFIDYTLSPSASKEITLHNMNASVNTSLEGAADVPVMQKPSYIRELSLNHLDFATTHQAFQPLWLKTMAQILPDFFDHDTLEY